VSRSPGVCCLPWIELGLNELHYEKFYSLVTGHEMKLPELIEKSDKIYSLTRMIKNDDTIPYKVHSSPSQAGATARRVVSKDDFERLLSLYHVKRGWDENGVPFEMAVKLVFRAKAPVASVRALVNFEILFEFEYESLHRLGIDIRVFHLPGKLVEPGDTLLLADPRS
jgi:hypothetical protein